MGQRYLGFFFTGGEGCQALGRTTRELLSDLARGIGEEEAARVWDLGRVIELTQRLYEALHHDIYAPMIEAGGIWDLDE